MAERGGGHQLGFCGPRRGCDFFGFGGFGRELAGQLFAVVGAIGFVSFPDGDAVELGLAEFVDEFFPREGGDIFDGGNCFGEMGDIDV